MGIYEELLWRGLIKDESSPEIKDKLNAGGMTFYIGTDPTGDSLHIGHFSSFLICKRLKDAGHNPIMLVGGATGLIGDPKPDSERPMITKEEVDHNFNCLKNQLTRLFDCEVVNNYDWCKDINFIDFLRDFGKFFNVNYMLSKMQGAAIAADSNPVFKGSLVDDYFNGEPDYTVNGEVTQAGCQANISLTLKNTYQYSATITFQAQYTKDGNTETWNLVDGTTTVNLNDLNIFDPTTIV